jgi:hypothetical protein
MNKVLRPSKNRFGSPQHACLEELTRSKAGTFMMETALAKAPEPGQLVNVRSRHWVVNEINKSAMPSTPLKPTSTSAQHLVSLVSIEDDAVGEDLQVNWEIEPGAEVIEKVALPHPTGFDPRRQIFQP